MSVTAKHARLLTKACSWSLEEKSSVKESPLWLETEKRLLSANPEEGLKALLAHETLVVTRYVVLGARYQPNGT